MTVVLMLWLSRYWTFVQKMSWDQHLFPKWPKETVKMSKSSLKEDQDLPETPKGEGVEVDFSFNISTGCKQVLKKVKVEP